MMWAYTLMIKFQGVGSHEYQINILKGPLEATDHECVELSRSSGCR